jgi:hypothetical protein
VKKKLQVGGGGEEKKKKKKKKKRHGLGVFGVFGLDFLKKKSLRKRFLVACTTQCLREVWHSRSQFVTFWTL